VKCDEKPDAAKAAALKASVEKARLEAKTRNQPVRGPPGTQGESREAPIIKTEIPALLPDEQTALLEFVVADDRTFLFAITKTRKVDSRSPCLHLPVKRKDLAQRTEAFRQQRVEIWFCAAATVCINNFLNQLKRSSGARPIWSLP
jgi:hypothetical protein